MQAAIGRVQLNKLPYILKRREEIFHLYKESGIKLLDCKNKNFKSTRYRAIMRTKVPQKIFDNLSKYEIKSKFPIEDWYLLDDEILYPNAKNFINTSISLPIFPSMTEKDVAKVLSVLKNFEAF